jgi:hypothetical protein
MPLLDHFHPPWRGLRHWEGFHQTWAANSARHLNRAIHEAIGTHLPVQRPFEHYLPLFAVPSVRGGSGQIWLKVFRPDAETKIRENRSGEKRQALSIPE